MELRPGVSDLMESGDLFGWSLAAGDFDNDGVDDLAIGAPGESLGAATAAGAAHVLYGVTLSGLTGAGSQFFHQNSAGVPDVAETSDYFGRTLSTGDFNGDGFVDLAVGAPYEGLGAATAAGAIHVFLGTSTGVNVLFSQQVTQNSLNVETAEAGDAFGLAL